jgi:hypothetical protein
VRWYFLVSNFSDSTLGRKFENSRGAGDYECNLI